MKRIFVAFVCASVGVACATNASNSTAVAAEEPAAPAANGATAEKPEEKAPAGEGQWAKFGAPVDGKTVVPAETLLSDPKAYVGQNIVVSGRVADVCSKAGCWMVIAEGDSTMRIRMKDHGFSVAKDGAGSDCRVQGEVVEIQVDPDTVAHFASESRKPELMPENSGNPVVYEMVASGVEFKAAASL